MNKEVNQIINIMDQTYKKEIAMYDKSFLMKSLEKRYALTGSKTAEAYSRYLEENSREADAFLDSLNINYSKFFRNPLTFALLEQWILPSLISLKSGGGEIRIWSAGCSAGQEAYSIAMLLDKLCKAGGIGVRFRIFATDISEEVLKVAREGLYHKDAVQNVRLNELEKYFTKMGETYRIDSKLRDNIVFSTYDLLDEFSANPPESIYGDFDIVFCSNLLFYYNPQIREGILQKVQKSMAMKGYLVTGEAEKALVNKVDKLQMIAPPAAIFQIKKM